MNDESWKKRLRQRVPMITRLAVVVLFASHLAAILRVYSGWSSPGDIVWSVRFSPLIILGAIVGAFVMRDPRPKDRAEPSIKRREETSMKGRSWKHTLRQRVPVALRLAILTLAGSQLAVMLSAYSGWFSAEEIVPQLRVSPVAVLFAVLLYLLVGDPLPGVELDHSMRMQEGGEVRTGSGSKE